MKAHEDFLLWDVLQEKLAVLQAAIKVNDVPVIRHLLQNLVHGPQSTNAVVDWVAFVNTNAYN